jgi:BirA family transcriptional regulator, biotin operon repressor / biotin---[acetyl-CoA-carboxylase] ligase
VTLDAATVGPLLRTRWLGRTWHWKLTTGSTNDDAKVLAEQGAPIGTVVVADMQTRGRGRYGNTWHAPRGGLWLSAVLRPQTPATALGPLGLAVAVAVAETIEAHGPCVELKWPNDVLLSGRKVAGILLEAATEGERVRHLVVGLGANLNVSRFPASLAHSAVSLHRVLGGTMDRAAFAADLCARLEEWTERFERDGAAPVIAAWLGRAHLGGPVRARSASAVVEGVAEGLDADGALRVRLADGRLQRVLAGELL